MSGIFRRVVLFLIDFYRRAYASVTDFDSYRQIYGQSIARTALYLCTLLIHVSAISALFLTLTFLPEIRGFAAWAETSFPDMELVGGKLKVEADLPMIIRYSGGDARSFVFIRQTTDPLPDFQMPAIIFAEDGLYLPDQDQPVIKWSLLQDQRISRSDMAFLMEVAKWLLLPMTFFVLLISMLFLRPAEALIFSLFGYSASARHAIRLTFRQYLTLAVYGLTPAILIELFGTVLGLTGFLFHLIYLVTAAIYIYTATTKVVAPTARS